MSSNKSCAFKLRNTGKTTLQIKKLKVDIFRVTAVQCPRVKYSHSSAGLISIFVIIVYFHDISVKTQVLVSNENITAFYTRRQ